VTSSEAIKTVSAADLYPVRIKGEAITDDLDLDYFNGSLDEFLSAAKALKAASIFIRSSVLSEDDFKTTLDDPLDDDSFDNTEPDEGEDQPEEVDLSTIHPALAEFKKYLDQECALLLIAKGGVAEIAYEIVESWYKPVSRNLRGGRSITRGAVGSSGYSRGKGAFKRRAGSGSDQTN
jgi:hypothetical protein